MLKKWKFDYIGSFGMVDVTQKYFSASLPAGRRSVSLSRGSEL